MIATLFRLQNKLTVHTLANNNNMLAAVFQGPNAIAVQQVPLSASKEVRLKVNACAVCGYDARVFRNGHSKVSPPVILGHELCGEVQETVRTRNGTIGAGSRVVVGWGR